MQYLGTESRRPPRRSNFCSAGYTERERSTADILANDLQRQATTQSETQGRAVVDDTSANRAQTDARSSIDRRFDYRSHSFFGDLLRSPPTLDVDATNQVEERQTVTAFSGSHQFNYEEPIDLRQNVRPGIELAYEEPVDLRQTARAGID